MKKIFSLIFLLFTINISAQHPDLQGRRWVPTVTTINGINAEPAYEPLSFPYVVLEFWSGGFTFSFNQIVANSDCEIGFTSHTDFTSTDLFEFIDYTFYSTTTDCNSSIIDFMNLYMSFYEDTITEMFNYVITDETDGSKTLVITNNNGDTVTYTDSFLVQAPEGIFQTWWYLHNLIVDGIDNIPPINEELPDVPMVFGYYNDNPTEFATQGCVDFLVGDANFDTDNNYFYLYNLIIQFDGCLNGDNDTYQNLYFNFYWETIPNGYSYSYSEDGQEKTFIVTNVNADQAIYKNWIPLDIQELENSNFNLYPNPVSDFIYIESDDMYATNEVLIYNYLGQEIITTKDTTIDMTGMEAGIYLVNIILNDGNSFIKKIIKN